MRSFPFNRRVVAEILILVSTLLAIIFALVGIPRVSSSLALAASSPSRTTIIIEPTRSTLHETPIREETQEYTPWNNPDRLAASYGFTCALNTSGKAFCWGSNTRGQAGQTASRKPITTPQQLPTPARFKSIKAGEFFTCGLTKDAKKVLCWGSNRYGQLGRNRFANSLSWASTPEDVQGLPSGGLKNITLGRNHACALTNSGDVYCWGDNYRGQIGDNTNLGVRPKPVKIAIGKATQIAAGANHTCALGQNHKVSCWGSAWSGQAGLAGNEDDARPKDYNQHDVLRPTQIVNTNLSFQQITAGGDTTCGIATDAKAYCWGLNNYVQYKAKGLRPTGFSATRLAVPGNITRVAMNWHVICTQNTQGQTHCSGRNDVGQLGPNVPLKSLYPGPGSNRGYQYGRPPSNQVSGLDASTVAVKQRAALAVGTTYTCTMSLGNQVFCVGNYAQGQLGNGRASANDSNALTMQRNPSAITLPADR